MLVVVLTWRLGSSPSGPASDLGADVADPDLATSLYSVSKFPPEFDVVAWQQSWSQAIRESNSGKAEQELRFVFQLPGAQPYGQLARFNLAAARLDLPTAGQVLAELEALPDLGPQPSGNLSDPSLGGDGHQPFRGGPSTGP